MSKLNADPIGSYARDVVSTSATQETLKPAEPRAPARKAKRNKLAYKHRWLISRDIVAALGRAGVECDIIVPERLLH